MELQEKKPLLFSNKDLKKLIWPLIIEQLLTVLVGMMDTIMVSYCGMKAMSGVSLVDGINVLLIGVFSALATGGAVLVSQYLGKKRPDAAKTAAKMLFYVVLLVSLAIMAICLIFRKPLLLTLFGNVEDEVMAASQAYFLMSALSYPVMAIYNAYCALLRCIGNPRATMFSSLIMNIVNLVGNAVEAMRGSGRITLSYVRTAHKASVSVCDDGPGMTPAAQKRIFEPYYTTKTSGENFGLGLYYCQNVMNVHEGSIRVSSAPGKGCTFTLIFPLAAQGRRKP